MKYKNVIELMKSKGIKFGSGMSSEEIIESENAFNISFPDELKSFLALAVPVSRGFYNWSNKSDENIDLVNKALKKPYVDILNEIKNENYWCNSWGYKPERIEDAIEIFEKEYMKSPRIIPIYSHRYIVDLKSRYYVLSIMGTDTICYANNLETYLEIEFKIKDYDKAIRCDDIPFWSNIIYD